MKKYFYMENGNFSLVLGRNTFIIQSNGWVANPSKRKTTEGWVDTSIEVGPFSFAWQWSITKFNITLSTSYEIRRRDEKSMV